MLKDKVIFLVGGCGLLGRSLAAHILQQDATVILADINAEAGERAVAELKEPSPGAHVDFESIDITSEASIRHAIDTVNNKYGKIDAVVNTAYPRNKNYGKKLEDVSYDSFCENVDLHLGGYFLVSKEFALFFKKQGYGNVINFSSIYGVVAPRFEIYDGTPMTTPVEYAAIKSAIVQLSRYFARYFKGTNVRFNCISPGGILDSQPESFQQAYKNFCMSKGMLDKEDISGAVIFLLSDSSRYMNGQNLVVDDGFSL